MEDGRKLAVYMHRADTPVSDYSPVGIAKHLTCVADYYLAQGIDHTRLVLVVDLATLRMGHLGRYPLGLLRRFFLYAWVSIARIFFPPLTRYRNEIMRIFSPTFRINIQQPGIK